MKKKYELVFISTFIDEKYINLLINSIVENNNSLFILFIIVNQTNKNLQLINSLYVDFVEISATRISLSKARNFGLDYLSTNSIQYNYLMFPDDDSTYDNIFFDNFKDVLDRANTNYLIDVYGVNSKDLYIKHSLPDGSLVKGIRPHIAMSVNMLINESTISKVGMFDEKMGVGAKYGGGEDLDYFLRCVNNKGAFVYTNKLWNYHPKFETKHKTFDLKMLMDKYKNYGRGVIYLHFKHKMYISGMKLCISALLGSFVAFIMFDFKLSVARLYAFIIRTHTFIMLVTGIYD